MEPGLAGARVALLWRTRGLVSCQKCSRSARSWFYLESDFTNPLQRPSEWERQSERARFKGSFKMFESRHDSFVYCQDWKQTVMSLTLALSVERSSRGDGVCREGTSTDETRVCSHTRLKSLKKCVSEQQRGLCSSATEHNVVLGQLHHAAVNAKLHWPKNTTETHYVWTHIHTCMRNIRQELDFYLIVFSFF